MAASCSLCLQGPRDGDKQGFVHAVCLNKGKAQFEGTAWAVWCQWMTPSLSPPRAEETSCCGHQPGAEQAGEPQPGRQQLDPPGAQEKLLAQ